MTPDALPARARILPRILVSARDGVELCTDVYLPVCEEPRPTVLVRTPYGRNRPFLMRLASHLSDRGFCVATQDSRGRYGSAGTFDLDREEEDTQDTLTWLSCQEWGSGRVALLGVSVASYSNFRAAAQEPPEGVEVATIVSLMGALDCHSLFYRDGALVLHWALPWVTLMSPEHLGRSSWLELPWPEIFRRRPLSDLADSTRGNSGIWRDVVTSPRFNDAWRRVSTDELLDLVRAPALFLCGCNDFLLGHTLRGFADLTRHGSANGHRMVLGNWDHQSLFRSFRKGGNDEPASHLDLMEVVTDWLERGLAPEIAEVSSPQPAVLAYVTGARSWVGSDTFPPSTADEEKWFLSSKVGANSAAGDGRLLREPPTAGGRDVFTYDPEDPVPTVGGAVWPFDPAGLSPGMADQSRVEERADVLVYTSDPLESATHVVGPVTVTLWIATSVRDTDFTAKLVDVSPVGEARILQDGIQRARYREGRDRETWLEPQRPTRLTIDLDAVAHRFAPGHRIRLEVSSSNFPKFDRHPNTSGPLHEATTSMVAQQMVLFGGSTRSCLSLPVLSSDEFERLGWRPAPPQGSG